jgi:ribosomal protein S18 acetylase RimI-like enzyme
MKLSDINEIVDLSNRNMTENTVHLIYLWDLYETDLKFNFVCLESKNIIGFISCTINKCISCNALCVDMPFRERRIGERLMNEVIEEGRHLSDKFKISLYVRADNVPAINFYIKMGFIIIKKHVPYYEDGGLGHYMEYSE